MVHLVVCNSTFKSMKLERSRSIFIVSLIVLFASSFHAKGQCSIALTSTTGTDTQTLCINTAITNITFSTTAGATDATITGLPNGVSGAWASDVVTISGSPIESGIFNYTITPTGGACNGTNTANGTITVTADNTVGAASSTPTLCINTPLTDITHATTLATGIGAATGLPAGVSAAWLADVITISGTPTASGTFNYSIPLTGGCGIVNATGMITVTPDMTVAAGSSAPTLCINTLLTNITHATTLATGIGAATGLPTGVTAAWSSNVITISGTPSASGTFNYSIPLTGGCGTVNATGTITVTPNNTITLTSAVGTNAQTKCINTVITAITYSTTGATGATFSGLPAGVTGSWNANVVTISGTPTASGTFNYTVTTTGGCTTPAVTASGSITVTPNAAIISVTGTSPICIGTIATYTANGVVLGGGTGAWSSSNTSIATVIAGTGVVTAVAAGTANIIYTITGGCNGTPSAIQSITVNPLPTITLGTNPTICLGTTSAGLPYTATTSSPNQYSIDFNAAANTAGFADVSLATLPSTPINIVVPASGLSGAYNGTLTVRNSTTTCLSAGYAMSVSVNAITSGSLSNPAAICTNGTITLSPSAATGSGTITYQWQVSTDNLIYANIALATSATYTTPPISATRYFKRIATSTLNAVSCPATTSAITVSQSGASSLRTDGNPALADWKNPAAWFNGAVPGIDQGTLGCPVIINHPLVLDNTYSGTTDLQIRRGVVSINGNITDPNQINRLLMSKPGSATSESVLDILSGTVVTFNGGTSMTAATLIVRSGATLILGPEATCSCYHTTGYSRIDALPDCSTPTSTTGDMLYIGNKSQVIVEQGGLIIVNGNVQNDNNVGNLLVNGHIYITGNYRSATGSVTVTQDNLGVGDMVVCGSMTSNGGSTIFGATVDCLNSAVPCVASNLLCANKVNITPYGNVGWCNGTALTATLTNASIPTDLLTWEYTLDATSTWTTDPTQTGDLIYDWSTSLAAPTYYRAKITKAVTGCASFSFISYNIPGTNRWRGKEEVPGLQTPGKPNDWNNINNWCANIPTFNGLPLTINTGNPTVYTGDVANVQDVTIMDGAKIKLSGAATLNIYGDLINDGYLYDSLSNGTVHFKESSSVSGIGLFDLNHLTIESGKTVNFPTTPNTINVSGDVNFYGTAQFVQDGSEITLTGSQNQTINGGGNEFWNFNLFKSGNPTVSLTSQFKLLGRMEMFTASTVNSNGNLLVRSRGVVTGDDGSIGPIPAGGAVTGNVTVERYMDPLASTYRYIASPVEGVWKPDQFGNLYAYSQTLGWYKHRSAMTIGSGYAGIVASGAQITWSVTGTTDSDSYTWNNFPTEGWYLIGNPFPAAVSWASSEWTRTNMSTTIAITDNHQTNYPTYFRYYDYLAGTAPPAGGWGFSDIQNGVIAMGQAFWVYAGAGGSLTINQNAKTKDDGSFYRIGDKSVTTDQLTVNLDNGKLADQVFLKLHDKATENFDFGFDLPKLWNEKMNVYLLSRSNQEMLMHTLNELTDEVKIPIGIQVTEPGEYKLSFGNADKFSRGSDLYLIDMMEGMAILVSGMEPYSFTVKDASQTINDRFYLSLNRKIDLNKEAAVSAYPNPFTDKIFVEVMGTKQNSSLNLIDVNGKILVTSEFTRTETVDMTNYPAGMYILKVKTANGVVTKKIVKQE